MEQGKEKEALTDFESSASEDMSRITLSVKQIRVIVAGIISGILLVSGTLGTGIFRWDKFGLSDFEHNITPIKEQIDECRMNYKYLYKEVDRIEGIQQRMDARMMEREAMGNRILDLLLTK